jgi:hypothetical protein
MVAADLNQRKYQRRFDPPLLLSLMPWLVYVQAYVSISEFSPRAISHYRKLVIKVLSPSQQKYV